jgi:hypothetical protein
VGDSTARLLGAGSFSRRSRDFPRNFFYQPLHRIVCSDLGCSRGSATVSRLHHMEVGQRRPCFYRTGPFPVAVFNRKQRGSSKGDREGEGNGCEKGWKGEGKMKSLEMKRRREIREPGEPKGNKRMDKRTRNKEKQAAGEGREETEGKDGKLAAGWAEM